MFQSVNMCENAFTQIFTNLLVVFVVVVFFWLLFFCHLFFCHLFFSGLRLSEVDLPSVLTPTVAGNFSSNALSREYTCQASLHLCLSRHLSPLSLLFPLETLDELPFYSEARGVNIGSQSVIVKGGVLIRPPESSPGYYSAF